MIQSLNQESNPKQPEQDLLTQKLTAKCSCRWFLVK
jgi:hypothetical protein